SDSAERSTQVYFVAPNAAHAGVEAHQHGAKQASATNSSGRSRPSFVLPEQAQIIYVNPYSGEVLGQLGQQERFNQWAKKLHSRLLQSESWRWLIELAASCLLLMLLSGIYLGWPRRNQQLSSASPSDSMQVARRHVWRRWHIWIGLGLALLSFVMLSTGLTWSQYAGGQIRVLRDALGQAPAPAPKNLRSPAASAHTPLSWQAAWQITREQAPKVSVQLIPPSDSTGVWRASSFDRAQPGKRFDLIFDAYHGNTLYYADWAEQKAFGKATALGIPFHRGEFGWWNQALVLLFGLGLIGSIVSAWLMFYQRYRAARSATQTQAKLLLLLPSALASGAWRALPIYLWLMATLLCWLIPLLVPLALAVALLEYGLHLAWRQRLAAGI
ncbi:MAG: PepSY-associated TM helix domain-containing protein, partial [Pseudomonadota bacterium]